MRKAIAFALLASALTGCSLGKLERTDDAPLTAERAASYSSPASQAQTYNRHSLNALHLVDYGRVIDASRVMLSGTSETGARVGGAVGALNTINRGTSSTESAVLRILGGAVIGAMVESSLTQGEAIEYIIERRDGQLIALVSEYSIPVDTCVMMRTDSATQKTSLEVKDSGLCNRTMGQQQVQTALSGDDLYSAEEIARGQDCKITQMLKDEAKVEVYSATCSNGGSLVITCEWGSCRGL